jgi:glucose-1-phosphate cytidylyltransferase
MKNKLKDKKLVILAGGYGTRLSEETVNLPKPMVEIGGKPIIWHIIKYYSHFGVNDFIICCGYKGYMIKEYFVNYFNHNSDITIDLEKNNIEVHKKKSESWRITLIDTGEGALTGTRLGKVKDYVLDEEFFFFTYGDGLSNVNLHEQVDFFTNKDFDAVVTGVTPPGRFGAIQSEGALVKNFVEKPQGDGGVINGGFFILKPEIYKYIGDKDLSWEDQPLKHLAQNKKLGLFKHEGFWQPMDTLRDKNYLDELWANDEAPWKIWE